MSSSCKKSTQTTVEDVDADLRDASGKIELSGVRITQALYVLVSKLLELDASDAEIGSLIVIESE